MKTQLLFPGLLLVLIAVLFCPTRLSAQAAAGGAGAGGRLSFLSADDRAHYMKVREQVLASNPELKSEQESFQKEREAMKAKGADASADDRKTMRENFLAHNEKMNAAMKAADPTVGPIIDQIDAKMRERFQQGGGGAGNP